MATTFSTGTQSPTSHKPLEKIFEEAQSTGAICLCGRKLREYPKISSRYDLIDTISADLSKNRFSEVPKEVCDHAMLEELNCYHNVIKTIPEFIVQLQNLTFINLSRNQLAVIPPFISNLVSLEVLIASHNRLISLPEEMGILEKLMEIDVSCNEISHLPPQIGDLKSLKSLNVRRNILQELPVEISKLSLRKIDFSNNRISTIPTAFRKIETLEVILLENNPLTMPPAHLCTKGKKHIMKYLQIEAIKEDRRRGVLNEAEMKRLVRKSLPVTQTSDEFRNILESPEKWKRHTVLSSDSGYSTTDSIEKCGWSPSEANGDAERANMLAVRSAEVTKDPRQPANGYMQSPPNAFARIPENVQTFIPQPVKTNNPPENSYSYNAGQYSHSNYHNNSSPGGHPTSHETNSYENQNYRQTSYHHNSENHQTGQQNRTCYPRGNEIMSPTSSQRQNQYPSPSYNPASQSPSYGQFSPSQDRQQQSPSQQQESKYNQLSPTSYQNRYNQQQNTFQYTSPRSPQSPNINYRVKPPPVITSQYEYSPEPSPNSPLTPKTPTPGYYQSGQGYSPSYGGYSTGSNSPNAPITPVTNHPQESMEDEISRELQRQQADYNRRKQQAEQIRMQHEEEMRRQEEEDKESRRRAALKVQEEQRLLLERQMEEERQREEARLQEERRQQEEAHRKEEQRKREEEQRRKEEEKQKQEAQQYKVENNSGYNPGRHDRYPMGMRYNGHTAETYSMQYRKPGLKTSTANKEEKKSTTPYRRTVSDTVKKLQQPANKTSRVIKNGPTSPSSSSPLISPSPSPRSSVSSAGPSPASSSTSLNKDPKSAGGNIPRRPRMIDKTPTPTTSRTTPGGMSRPSTSSSITSSRNAPTSRTTPSVGTNSGVKKNHVTPEEEFRQKHQQIKSQTQMESQKVKSHFDSQISKQRSSIGSSSTTVPRSTNSSLAKRGGTVLSNSAMKVIESYKDSDPNYTMRRQLDHEHGEAKQLDCLRRTIESRLKVTLPDNLPETLKDGVLLCQLANNIRPRSVTSIHVPSPAVPKLTMAKCRKNVENFLEACRKLGVHREQICGAQDILEEKGISRLAVTASALIAVSTNPRSSAV